MADRITVTEADLRDAVRDPRYWTANHPERADYAAWVTDGFRAMYNSGEARGGVVQVRAYTRKRGGKVQQVGAHTRSAPPGGDLTTPVAAPAAIAAAPAVVRTLPLLGGAIAALPRPSWPGWSALFPDRPRPSLLEPRPPGARRRDTLGIVRTAPPEEGDGTPDDVPEERVRRPGTLAAHQRDAMVR